MKFFLAFVIALCIGASNFAQAAPSRGVFSRAWQALSRYLSTTSPEEETAPEDRFRRFLTAPSAPILKDSTDPEQRESARLLERQLREMRGVYFVSSKDYIGHKDSAVSVFLRPNQMDQMVLIIDFWIDNGVRRLLELPLNRLKPFHEDSDLPFALYISFPSSEPAALHGNANASLRLHLNFITSQKPLRYLGVLLVEGGINVIPMLPGTLVSKQVWRGFAAKDKVAAVTAQQFVSGDYPEPPMFDVCAAHMEGRL